MILAFAYVLDLFLGDPEGWPHPVRWMGALIEREEKLLRRFFHSHEYLAGIVLTFSVCAITYGVSFFLVHFVYRIHPTLGFLVEAFLIYTSLSVKSLKNAAAAVLSNLEAGDLVSSRQEVAKIVGRDTHQLSENEIIRATVETVAENTVDGIISPLFYAFLGGAPLAMFFKAASTLDSMVGYRNERYQKFGWASARFDDLLNFVPARVARLLIPLGAWILGLKSMQSLKIAFRDGKKHPSPNSGIAEAAFAGALGIQLGGVNFRNGKAVTYPLLGDRPALENGSLEFKSQDIIDSVRLSLAVSMVLVGILVAIKVGVMGGF